MLYDPNWEKSDMPKEETLDLLDALIDMLTQGGWVQGAWLGTGCCIGQGILELYGKGATANEFKYDELRKIDLSTVILGAYRHHTGIAEDCIVAMNDHQDTTYELIETMLATARRWIIAGTLGDDLAQIGEKERDDLDFIVATLRPTHPVLAA